jgi:hypothetical protein
LPAVFHVQEVTQPLGHSTSGSHERYKTAERLQWEVDNDCIVKMAEWMIDAGIATQQAIDDLRQNAITYTRECKQRAWDAFIKPVRKKRIQLIEIHSSLPQHILDADEMKSLSAKLNSNLDILFSEVVSIAERLKFLLMGQFDHVEPLLEALLNEWKADGKEAFNTKLYAEGPGSCLEVPFVPASYNDHSEMLNGFQVLNRYFDQLLENDPRVVAFRRRCRIYR